MKVFVQIPCLNEESTLPLVLNSIPKRIAGVSEIEILIVDDGSTDSTVKIAKEFGVTHFVHHTRNMGLARSFRDGIDYALSHGADIVVNTDGDNQYPQDKIADLVQPIIEGRADIVIADRQTATIEHFSFFKKKMQQFGSWVVNYAADTKLPDAASGFRAYSRNSLLRLNIFTQFSYCMETIIQAGQKRLAIVSIPITTNPKTRESRLFKNIWQHMAQSAKAIIRSYLLFKPLVFFGLLGGIALAVGLVPFVRFAILFALGIQGQHLQSLLFGSVFLAIALFCFALMVIAELQRANRILAEDQLERTKQIQYRR
ncbi:glycosyltransferase family 2 protein [Candidatus Saccharibacteria bacterium]|nr:glycosyltransferase family 2 protein [Candidatus Saccharibacteria bacterium]